MGPDPLATLPDNVSSRTEGNHERTRTSIMHYVAIVLLCIASAGAYGIVHDQFTARICVEYFTIGHPPVFGTDDPTLLAFGWGILATWWVGVILGIPLAIAARAGGRPKKTVRELCRPIAVLLAEMAVGAAVAGLIGWLLAQAGVVRLVEPMARRIPVDRHAVFLADLWAHSASYLFGFLGGAFTIVRVWRSRGKTALAAGTNAGD